MVDLVQGNLGFAEAVGNSVLRKSRVVLLTGEALLLRSRNNPAVLDQCRGAIVIKGGNAQNAA